VEADAVKATGSLEARRFDRAIIGSLVLGFAILAAVVVAAGWLLLRAEDFARSVDHSYTVESQLGEFRANFERAEAARRGFLIGGGPQFHQIYGDTSQNLAPALREIRRLTVDNSRQQARLDRLEPLLAEKLALLAQSIEERRSGGLPAAVAAFERPREQFLLEEIRRISTGMSREERTVLAARSARQTANTQLLLGVVVLAGVVLALVAAASTGVMRRYAAELALSEARLRRLNQGLETAVRERTADLTRANAEIQRFAYIVSHDLRSPLVNVMGFTSELEAAAKPLQKLLSDAEAAAPAIVTPEARQAVEVDLPESIGFIRSSSQKMDRLISAILKLSREGRRTLTPEPLAMNALVEGVVQTVHHQAAERGAEVSIEGELPDIVGDRLATEQVFSNLVENAIKYLSPDRPGRVRIRGRAEGARVVFEVEDNGRGIAPHDQERIFELFRRAGAQDQPGEGIGLAHVRALVHRLGGVIDCVSALDQGATFRLSLPAVLIRETGEPS
jgi:signal transduction histidine kinase